MQLICYIHTCTNTTENSWRKTHKPVSWLHSKFMAPNPKYPVGPRCYWAIRLCSCSDPLHSPWHNFTFPFSKPLMPPFSPSHFQFRTLVSNSPRKKEKSKERACTDCHHYHVCSPTSIAPAVLPATVHELHLFLARIYSPISSTSLQGSWTRSSPHLPPYQILILYHYSHNYTCCYFS